MPRHSKTRDSKVDIAKDIIKKESKILEISEAMEDENITEDDRMQLADMAVALMKQIEVYKLENCNLQKKDNAQLKIMNRSKQIIMDKNKTIALLNINKKEELKNNNGIYKMYQKVDEDVPESIDKELDKRYNKYVDDWFKDIEDPVQKKTSKKK